MERYFDIVGTMFKVSKKIVVFLVVVLGLIVIVITDSLFKKSDSGPGQMIEENRQGLNQPDNSQGNVQKTYSGPVNPKAPIYSGRPLGEIRFGPGFEAPQELISKHTKELAVLATTLNKNPLGSGGVNDWIAVGVIKKFFNDYEGTRDAWEYANVLYPNNALSFANLGALYGFYLHDNSRAELNYQKAITNDSYQPSYYLGLADFYKQVDKIHSYKVPEIILDGLSRIKDINLLLYLASFYKDEGDKTNAIKYYNEVLKISPDQAGIKEEIDKLSN